VCVCVCVCVWHMYGVGMYVHVYAVTKTYSSYCSPQALQGFIHGFMG